MKTGFAADLILSHPSSSTLETELRIIVHRPGSIGPLPTVGVEQAGRGIDWDKGNFLLYPEVPLTALSPEDVEAIRESVKKGQSWHAYQSYKKQADRIAALEAEVATLTAALASRPQLKEE